MGSGCRRVLSGAAFCGLALLAAPGCGKPGRGTAGETGVPTAASGGPTVLLVTIDTLRADRIGCYGKADAGTPALDRLAAGGVRVAHAQTTAPLTLPAHTSLLTGRSLPAHGVFNNGTFALGPAVPTLAERFSKAGWATGAFVSSPVLARRYGLGRGFDAYDDRIVPSKQSRVVHWEERPGAQTVKLATDWLAVQGAKPAFLWVHLFEPHRPYEPPPEIAARFPDDKYQGEVATADAAVGQLLEALAAQGRTDKALIVVVGDHGEGLGEHGEATHGMYLYRGTMEVPAIVNGPAWGVAAGTVLDAAFSLADVAPTVLDLVAAGPAGASHPAALDGADGTSLAAAFSGKGPAPADRAVFAESHIPQLEFGWSGLRAVVRGTRKYIDAPRPELYDVGADPAEAKDLAAADAAGARALRAGLDDLVRRGVAAGPAQSAERALGSAEQESLRSLGYVASGGKQGASRALVDPRGVDPKDRKELLSRFDEAGNLVRLGRAADACALYDEMAKAEPKNGAVLFEYGQALIQAGRLPDATAIYKRLVAAHPDSGTGWFRLGQLLDNQKDAKGAEAAYRRAMDVEPNNLDPRRALAGLLADLGRYREAIDILEKVRDLDPADAAVTRDIERFWAKLRG